MVGDEGKKVEGDKRSLKLSQCPRRGKPLSLKMAFVGPREGPRMVGTTSYDLVSEKETSAAHVYKISKPWLRADQMRVEIRRGHALRVIGQGDETVKVKLPRNNEMRVREATASMSTDGVLTIVIPKRHRPRKWYEYVDFGLIWFKTVHVGISS